MPRKANSYFYKRAEYPNVHMDEDGTWHVRKWSQVRGKQLFRQIQDVNGKKDAAKAFKLGMQMFVAFEGGKLKEKGPETTVGDLVRDRRIRRRKEREANEISRSSLANSLTVLKRIEEVAGHLKPTALTADWFKDLYLEAYAKVRRKHADDLAAGRMTEEQVVQAYPRFANTIKELRALTKKAHSLGLIRELPKFKNPDPKKSLRRIYLEPEQAWKLINGNLAAWKGDNTARLAKWIYLTGIRPYEAVQIRKEHFNWEKGSVRIVRPKPGTPPREIVIHPTLIEESRAHFERTGGEWLFPGRNDPSKPMSDGGYMDPWRKLCGRVGIKTDIYSLRHSFLTDMADQDVNVIWLAKYTGTSVEMLEKVYYKPRPEKMARIAELQGQRIFRGSLEDSKKKGVCCDEQDPG